MVRTLAAPRWIMRNTVCRLLGHLDRWQWLDPDDGRWCWLARGELHIEPLVDDGAGEGIYVYRDSPGGIERSDLFDLRTVRQVCARCHHIRKGPMFDPADLTWPSAGDGPTAWED